MAVFQKKIILPVFLDTVNNYVLAVCIRNFVQKCIINLYAKVCLKYSLYLQNTSK